MNMIRQADYNFLIWSFINKTKITIALPRFFWDESRFTNIFNRNNTKCMTKTQIYQRRDSIEKKLCLMFGWA